MNKSIIWAAVYEPSITKEEAERMNASVSSHSDSTKKWLEQRLAERWAFLKEQGYSE